MGLSQIISKETRRGGENGPGLGDKAPDGEAEAGKGWSPESQGPDARLCSFKRLLLCSFSSLPRSFCIAMTFCPYSPTPGPFVCLQTRLTLNLCTQGREGGGCPTGLTVKDEILKGLLS